MSHTPQSSYSYDDLISCAKGEMLFWQRQPAIAYATYVDV